MGNSSRKKGDSAEAVGKRDIEKALDQVTEQQELHMKMTTDGSASEATVQPNMGNSSRTKGDGAVADGKRDIEKALDQVTEQQELHMKMTTDGSASEATVQPNMGNSSRTKGDGAVADGKRDIEKALDQVTEQQALIPTMSTLLQKFDNLLDKIDATVVKENEDQRSRDDYQSSKEEDSHLLHHDGKDQKKEEQDSREDSNMESHLIDNPLDQKDEKKKEERGNTDDGRKQSAIINRYGYIIVVDALLLGMTQQAAILLESDKLFKLVELRYTDSGSYYYDSCREYELIIEKFGGANRTYLQNRQRRCTPIPMEVSYPWLDTVTPKGALTLLGASSVCSILSIWLSLWLLTEASYDHEMETADHWSRTVVHMLTLGLTLASSCLTFYGWGILTLLAARNVVPADHFAGEIIGILALLIVGVVCVGAYACCSYCCPDKPRPTYFATKTKKARVQKQ